MSADGNFEVHYTLDNTRGFRISGDHRVVSSVDTITIEPGEITMIQTGVRVIFSAAYYLEVKAHATLPIGLFANERIHHESMGDKKIAANIQIPFVNLSKSPITIRAGQIVASVYFIKQYQLGLVERDTMLNASNISEIATTVTAFLGGLYQNNPTATIDKYFMDKNPMPEIKKHPDYQETAMFIGSQLYASASNSVKFLIAADFEAQKQRVFAKVNDPKATATSATLQNMAETVAIIGNSKNEKTNKTVSASLTK